MNTAAVAGPPMTAQEWIVVLLSLAGVVFMLVSAVGLIRLPDIFSRMHAAGKASTAGVSCLLLAAGIHFWDANLLWRMILLIALIFATAPIATTAMARAAYRTGSPRQLNLARDEMGDKALPASTAQPAQPAPAQQSLPASSPAQSPLSKDEL